MDEKMNNSCSPAEECDYTLEDIIAEAQTEALCEETESEVVEENADTPETEDSVYAEYDVYAEDEEYADTDSSDAEGFFPKGYDPKFAYNSMTEYAEKLHVGCKKAIRSGYVTLVVLPLILSVMLKMTDSDKIFFLVVWIICMFFLAAALILIAFVDHEIQERLDEIHANEKFGSLMSFERAELLSKLREERHLRTIWHVHEHHESEVQE